MRADAHENPHKHPVHRGCCADEACRERRRDVRDETRCAFSPRASSRMHPRPAHLRCVAQHARRQCSLRLSQRCIWHRDCAASAFESAQNFARKRANAWQILVGFGAPPMQNSASVHRVRFTTRMISAKVVAELALHLLPRLRDSGVQKCALKISRENARMHGKFYLILAYRPCKNRPACTACVAKHA